MVVGGGGQDATEAPVCVSAPDVTNRATQEETPACLGPSPSHARCPTCLSHLSFSLHLSLSPPVAPRLCPPVPWSLPSPPSLLCPSVYLLLLPPVSSLFFGLSLCSPVSVSLRSGKGTGMRRGLANPHTSGSYTTPRADSTTRFLGRRSAESGKGNLEIWPSEWLKPHARLAQNGPPSLCLRCQGGGAGI